LLPSRGEPFNVLSNPFAQIFDRLKIDWNMGDAVMCEKLARLGRSQSPSVVGVSILPQQTNSPHGLEKATTILWARRAWF
jgi:hypothetical protein